MASIILPTLAGMAAAGTPFKGVLFAGLMIGPAGPQLIEFNVRFGDPETQAILPRLQDDFLALLLACADGTMDPTPPRFAADAALTIVIAADGYPVAPCKGGIIDLGTTRAQPDVVITQAGTKQVDGALVADGGRVLNVTGRGATIADARERAYAAAALVDWPDGIYRRDIGARALQRVPE